MSGVLRSLAIGLVTAAMAFLVATSSGPVDRAPSPIYARASVRSRLTRLGPAPTRTLELGGERRSVVPSDGRQIFEAKLEEGCTVHVAAANVGVADAGGDAVEGDAAATMPAPDDAEPPTFVVGFLGPDGPDGPGSAPMRIELPHEQTWQDITVSVPPGGSDGLVLDIEGANAQAGVWSRPMEICPLDTGVQPPANVILVSLDTLRADRLGSYGNDRGLTPNLDRFATEGAAFMHAYSQYPNTLASHATLFTGYYGAQHQLTGALAFRLPRDIDTLAGDFSDAGYVTVAFTEDAFVSSDFGFQIGFDRYDDGDHGHRVTSFPGRAAETFAQGVEWLEDRPAAPFFLFVHTYQVHTPYTPSPAALHRVLTEEDRSYEGRFAERFLGLEQIAYNRGEVSLSQTDLRRIERLYDAETVDLDDAVGELLDAIDRLGLDSTTLVVFFADHGEEFAEHGQLGHGQSLHDEELHVPLLLRLPGVVPAGERITQPVGLIDVGPTIAELAGIGTALPLTPARSMAATVLRGDTPPRATVFSELIDSARTCDFREDKTLRGCPYGAVSARDGRYSYIDALVTGEESLFDLAEDPGELHDMASERPAVVARFRRLVGEYRDFVAISPMKGMRADVEQATLEKLRALGYLD